MRLFLMVVIFICSNVSFAFQDKDININAGFGVFGSRGIFGVSGEYFLSENNAVSLVLGLDFVGATSAIGYKYFSKKLNNGSSVFDKCFFIFECDSHIYLGPSLQYAGGSTLKIIEGTNEREYKIDPKWLGLVSVGFRDVYKNNITLDVEISYRGIISGGKAEQTYGALNNDRKSIEMGYRSLGINVGVGYLF